MENLIINQDRPTRWVQQLPSSTALLDKDLNLINASLKWFQIFGFKKDEVIGKPFFELFPEHDELWQDKFDYAFEGLTDIKIVERRELNAPTESKELLWKINPWKDGYGNSIGIILNVQDVSEKAALEFELKKTRSLLEQKGLHDNIGSWEYNVKTKTLYCSQELLDIMGETEDGEFSLEDITNLFKEGSHRNNFKQLLNNAMEYGLPWDKNLRIAGDASSPKKWVNTIGRPKFKNERCTRVIGTIHILEDPKTETEIQSQDFNKIIDDGILNHVSIGMALIDFKSGRLVSVNKSLVSLLGIPEATLLDFSFVDFLWFTQEEQKQWYKSILINGSFNSIEKEVFHEDVNQKIILRLSGKLIDDKGRRFILASCENVTRYHNGSGQVKAKLDFANQELDRLTHFMHMATHNLKAHATNFDLLLNFLKNETNDSERNTLIQMLNESTQNLTSSIKGLRELVTIRHSLKNNKEEVDLNNVIYKTIQNNNGLVKQKNAKIHNEVIDGFKIHGIPIFIENTVSNLLVNAMKFKNENDKPIIYLSVTENDKYQVLHIEDNGMGIDLKEEKNKIFALYKTLQNTEKSCGIGLYLAKYQMDLIGGKITVESELNQGTKFSLHFLKKEHKA